MTDTSQQKNQENETGKQAEDWLKEVASRSYEPELLISGAGIYLSSNLPTRIESVFDYYSQNISAEVDSMNTALPILIYAFLNRYDNLRPERAIIRSLSIQSDVIQENYVKLFIVYSKRMDKKLKSFCKSPRISAKIPEEEQNKQLDSLNLFCLQSFFKIYLNDSLYQKPEFVFHQHPNAGEKGLLTFLPGDLCKKRQKYA